MLGIDHTTIGGSLRLRLCVASEQADTLDMVGGRDVEI